MPLKQEILDRFPHLLDNRNDAVIAAELSVNRRKPTTRKIGVPDVLTALGVQSGNVCLDKLKDAQAFRHLWYLLQNNNLPIGDTSVQSTILACNLTDDEQQSLIVMGTVADIVTSSEVTRALGE